MAQRPPADRRGGDLFSRLGHWFQTGPFAWMTNRVPRRGRFKTGEHMHGLDRHDVAEGEPRATGTGPAEMPRPPSREPPGR